MDLYFFQVVNTAPSEAGNWFEDTGGMTAHGAVPTSGDTAYIYNGTCDTTSGIVADYIHVASGATLSVVASGTVAGDNQGTVALVEAGATLDTNSYTVQDNRGTVTTNIGSITVNYGTVTNQNGTITTDWTTSTDRYFIDQGNHEGSDSSNWSKDPGFVLAGNLPNTGMNAYIYSGTCDTTDDWTAETVNVAGGTTLVLNTVSSVVNNGTITTNNGTVVVNNGTVTTSAASVTTNNGTITTNTGTVTTNTGTVTTNASGGTITSNSGYVTGNSGTIAANVGGIVTTNTGTVTTNTGTVTTNASGGIVTHNVYGSGIVTTNNGVVRIGVITGGAGTLAASAATDLSAHTAGANVTLPSGGGSLTWW